MPAIAHDGPYTIVSGMLPGETEREVRSLLQQGYVEVPVIRKEDLLSKQFCRVKTRSGTRAEEQWTLVRRAR